MNDVKSRRDVLTTGDVARMCQVAPRTVTQWCDKKGLVHSKLPGSKDRRIMPQDLLRFLADHDMSYVGADEILFGVLVVSRDPSIVQSIYGEDLIVRSASNSFDAGTIVGVHHPKTVVFDMALGEDAVQEMNASIMNRDSKTRTIALANEDEGDLYRSYYRDFFAVVPKPVDPNRLNRVVRGGKF